MVNPVPWGFPSCVTSCVFALVLGEGDALIYAFDEIGYCGKVGRIRWNEDAADCRATEEFGRGNPSHHINRIVHCRFHLGEVQSTWRRFDEMLDEFTGRNVRKNRLSPSDRARSRGFMTFLKQQTRANQFNR